MSKPKLICNFDYDLGIWKHRLPHHPSFLLQEALREYFDVFKRDEIPVRDADVIFNTEPIVANGGTGADLFLQGKKTMYYEKTPHEHIISNEVIQKCDWIFVQSPSYLYHFPKEKSSLLLDAIDPAYHYIPQIGGFEFDIVFLGNESGSVRKPLLDVLEKHFKVLRFSGELGIPSAHLLSKGKLVLGIFDKAMEEGKTGIEYRTFLFSNVRPALLHFTPDLLEIGFIPHIHFLPYESTNDLIPLAQYYLNHDKDREEVGETMKKVLQAEHTYRHRAEQIYETFLQLH